MPETAQFKACYRHPKQPAVKNCQYCEQPICRECEKESGDHRMCGPCKKKLVSRAAMAAGPQPQRAQFELGEVTVFRDGTFVEPDRVPSNVESPPPEADEVAPDELARPETARQEQPETPEETIEPAPTSAGEGLKESLAGERDGLPQVVFALPFALGVTLAVGGLWLIIALIFKRWTQISVFTLGLAVPWVFYNATTKKKRAGRKVWTEQPVALVAMFSFTIVALAAPLMEYLVYKLVYSGFMKPDIFVQEFFDGFGWAMISVGLTFALLTPFLLKIGGRWDVPRLRLRRRRKITGA